MRTSREACVGWGAVELSFLKARGGPCVERPRASRVAESSGRPGADSRAAPCGASVPAAGGAGVVLERASPNAAPSPPTPLVPPHAPPPRPTTFVQKYTARAQLKPSGAPEPAFGARETGGGGRPARFCQQQTHVLAEQFSSIEHNAFRIPYLSDTIPEAAFHRQAVKTVAYLRVSTPQQDVRSQRLAILEYARTHDIRIDDFIEATASGQASEKRRRLDELTSVLQRGEPRVVHGGAPRRSAAPSPSWAFYIRSFKIPVRPKKCFTLDVS